MKICFICVRRGPDDKILAKFAADYSIELFRDCDINSPEFLTMITKFNCDIFVSMSFDQIFKPQIIDLAHLVRLTNIYHCKFLINAKRSDLLNQTQQHKMCVWYAKGVFNMKFQINNDKMKIFSTNQNNADDKRRDKYNLT